MSYFVFYIYKLDEVIRRVVHVRVIDGKLVYYFDSNKIRSSTIYKESYVMVNVPCFSIFLM